MRSESRVYFMKPVGMDGPIKIGCSEKPMKRLLTLAAWSPFPLEVIGSVLGDFDDENMLHRRFSDLHTRKEWFMSSPLLRGTIDKILAGMPIKEACETLETRKPIRNQGRPLRSPDRELFLDWGRRLRKARHTVWNKRSGGSYHWPADIEAIMHNWRCDKVNDHFPVTPSPEQIARLEEYVADPLRHSVFEEYKHWKPVKQDNPEHQGAA